MEHRSIIKNLSDALSKLLPRFDTFLAIPPVGVVVPLQIAVPFLYRRYIVSPRVDGNGAVHHSDTG